MATPNYGYEKRQRELAKKKKQEEKRKAKAERKTTGAPEDGLDTDAPSASEDGTQQPPAEE